MTTDLHAALQDSPKASWVLISLPGAEATAVARQALDQDKHVFLNSNAVSLEDEVALKHFARQKGLLVMGPDCGTAIINGIGLGFANRVRWGNIGIIGASGTGMQAIASEIHNLGHGISQAIGTGGRDLQAEVDAITSRQALDLLGRDPATDVIVLVSKPPSASVVTHLLRAAQATDKPVVVYLVGFPPPARQIGNIHFANSLAETAELAVQISIPAEETELSQRRNPFTGYVRGFFSGGTLAYETLVGLQAILSPIYTNIPIRAEQTLPAKPDSKAHIILDMGTDDFTRDHLHPVLDCQPRIAQVREAIDNPDVAYILLDVVLGVGVHPDPAGELGPVIAEAKAKDKKVLAIVIGTDDDPQHLNSQIELLIAHGATVFSSTHEAVDYIFNRIPTSAATDYPPVSLDAFNRNMIAVNIGLPAFSESLQAQGAKVTQVG